MSQFATLKRLEFLWRRPPLSSIHLWVMVMWFDRSILRFFRRVNEYIIAKALIEPKQQREVSSAWSIRLLQSMKSNARRSRLKSWY